MKEDVYAVRHRPTHDSGRINRVTERASTEQGHINHAVSQLRGLEFPAFKHTIIAHAKSISMDPDLIALFETLDGSTEFRDGYDIQKSLEQKFSLDKGESQMTDETRQNPNFRTRETTSDASIKEREAVNRMEERDDYPEVTPTAMSNFVCSMCGKPFQNQDDLARHRKFEGTHSA